MNEGVGRCLTSHHALGDTGSHLWFVVCQSKPLQMVLSNATAVPMRDCWNFSGYLGERNARNQPKLRRRRRLRVRVAAGRRRLLRLSRTGSGQLLNSVVLPG
jgi:hypothetical protein